MSWNQRKHRVQCHECHKCHEFNVMPCHKVMRRYHRVHKKWFLKYNAMKIEETSLPNRKLLDFLVTPCRQNQPIPLGGRRLQTWFLCRLKARSLTNWTRSESGVDSTILRATATGFAGHKKKTDKKNYATWYCNLMNFHFQVLSINTRQNYLWI